MSPRLMLALAALLIGLVIGQSPGGIHTAAASSSVDVFVSSFVDGGIYRVDSETGDTELIATLGFPAEDMVVDSNGILYVGGITTGVKRVDTNTNTVLSDVGINICGPEGLSIDSSGNVYANTRLDPCDHSGVWRIDGGTAETAMQVVPPFTSWGEGTAFLTHPPYEGHLIAAAADASLFGDKIVRSSPDDLANNDSPTTFIGGLFHLSIPVGLAVNSAGEVFVADAGNGLIRRYAPDGTFLGNFASVPEPRFMEFDTDDNLYVTEDGTDNLLKFAPDGTSTVLTNVPDIIGIAIAPPRPVAPAASISPHSGPPGTQFSVAWSGFTPNSTLSSHLKKPDGTELPTLQFPTDSEGEGSHIIDSTGFELGTYEHWAVDDATGSSTGVVSFTTTLLVVIDPGHGGVHSGAVGCEGNLEKQLALEVSTLVKDKLTASGYSVLLTRETDVLPVERAELANANDAAAFLSIHMNSSKGDCAGHGKRSEAFYAKGRPAGKALAADICQVIGARFDKRRCSVKPDTATRFKKFGLGVLRNITPDSRPAALFEVVFIDNLTDFNLLQARTADFAQAIADGIECHLQTKPCP